MLDNTENIFRLYLALGLVAFFIGAVATHVRARVFYNIAFPMMCLALAVASLVVLL